MAKKKETKKTRNKKKNSKKDAKLSALKDKLQEAKETVLASPVSLDVNQDEIDNLKAQLAITLRLIPIAEKRYLEYPTDRNCYALTKLMETAVALMEKIKEAKLYESLETAVVQNFEKAYIRMTEDLIESVRELREAIYRLTPESKHERVMEEVNQFLLQVGSKLDEGKEEIITDCLKEIKMLLN